MFMIAWPLFLVHYLLACFLLSPLFMNRIFVQSKIDLTTNYTNYIEICDLKSVLFRGNDVIIFSFIMCQRQNDALLSESTH